MWWLIGIYCRALDFWGRGPGIESGISHNDPDALQDHCEIMQINLRVERETYSWGENKIVIGSARFGMAQMCLLNIYNYCQRSLQCRCYFPFLTEKNLSYCSMQSQRTVLSSDNCGASYVYCTMYINYKTLLVSPTVASLLAQYEICIQFCHTPQSS